MHPSTVVLLIHPESCFYSIFPSSYTSVFLIHFLSDQITSFSYSSRIVLLVENFLGYPSSKNVSFFFIAQRQLCWTKDSILSVIFFQYLKIIPVRNAVLRIVSTSAISLTCKKFSLPSVCRNLTVMCPGIDSFGFILVGVNSAVCNCTFCHLLNLETFHPLFSRVFLDFHPFPSLFLKLKGINVADFIWVCRILEPGSFPLSTLSLL